ncbi:hypothetical protein EX30DRAFT_366190 [Ascodesmis nigricans]|uniref:Uncharacterized protein n=1 Tax=Ascodesmis nigricans TaxID=341454 RepID=A0A4S2MMD6_9PEZI|nr:hypothetical protein EX30DRAFT_366190 [Ascodesmis nigricans]
MEYIDPALLNNTGTFPEPGYEYHHDVQIDYPGYNNPTDLFYPSLNPVDFEYPGSPVHTNLSSDPPHPSKLPTYDGYIHQCYTPEGYTNPATLHYNDPSNPDYINPAELDFYNPILPDNSHQLRLLQGAFPKTESAISIPSPNFTGEGTFSIPSILLASRPGNHMDHIPYRVSLKSPNPGCVEETTAPTSPEIPEITLTSPTPPPDEAPHQARTLHTHSLHHSPRKDWGARMPKPGTRGVVGGRKFDAANATVAIKTRATTPRKENSWARNLELGLEREMAWGVERVGKWLETVGEEPEEEYYEGQF